MITFADRLRSRRKELGLSQQALADQVGITIRSIQNYESGKHYPHNLEIASRLADVLGTTVDALLAKDGFYILEAAKRGGSLPKRDIRILVEEIVGLFAGGSLDEQDRDAAMQALNDAYWSAKAESKKYAPKKK